MTTTQANQVNFRPWQAVENRLGTVPKGKRSQFINQAILNYRPPDGVTAPCPVCVATKRRVLKAINHTETT